MNALSIKGFRKIDPEKWEFANEDFVKDQKHLLKNIHRRKPIHSHSNPQGTADPERTAYEEEIDKLSREKAALAGNVLKFKQEQATAKVQLEDLTERLGNIEQRQGSLLTFLEKAVKNPDFVEQLTQRLESMDVSVYNKKRRLPEGDEPLSDRDFVMVDNHSSSKPEFGFPQDFCDKLRLELSPAADNNLLSHSTQSSNEDGESSSKRISDRLQKDLHKSGETLYGQETLELSDTGTSFGLKMDSPLSQRAEGSDTPKVNSFQQSLTPNEEADSQISCHLNLSLASSPLPVSKNQSPAKTVHVANETGICSDTRSKTDGNEVDRSAPFKNHLSDGSTSLSPSKNNKHVTPSPPARANDGFWEQFLTERPGSSDTEEASSNFRAHPYDEPEARKVDQGLSKNIKSAQHLSL
ncbi:OLC1v1018967C1 [Oldenlandia corymbosa var. corymbosa]|uniref:OLC1v1018967C1 n=1 Tax=Oldenlandia corymbosa var. corymbosa TaxID=529605 RepID=A0AAV1ECV5_OLDCO|nr:OLC1v1018967C1 [Oldenlandia corymbosa var. corymbosa]